MRRMLLGVLVFALLGGIGMVTWRMIQSINSLSSSPLQETVAMETGEKVASASASAAIVSETTTTVAVTSATEPTTTQETTTTTTKPPFVDYANSVHLSIPSQEIEAGIDWTGPAFDSGRFNPRGGRLDWWLGDDTVGPCENGSIFILGHNPGKFRDLVDDPDPGANDSAGLAVSDLVFIELEDSIVCEYRVVQFESGFGASLEGTPARRFLKDTWAQEDWDNVIVETGSDESVLYLLTSGGREDEYEWVNGGWHKPYTDVVKLVLVPTEAPLGTS